MVTDRQLASIMPTLPEGKRQLYLPYLNDAMMESEINSPVRVAAFLAQLAHESAELKFWRELADGSAYEGRRDLGNTQPGDGVRFKGRGPIQITGRANYERIGKVLGIDLINQPELLEQPQHGFRSAGYFWRSHGLNESADRQTEAAFKEITKRINGGLNGYAERVRYYRRALSVLATVSVDQSPAEIIAPPIQSPPSIIPLAVPAPEVPHASDSKKSVQAGIGATTIIAGLTTAAKWLGAHSNEVMTACICITALALVFMFRQLILAAIREWLKGQNINV